MTLYRHILAGMLIMLIGCFLGTLYISTGNLKQFLGSQLEAHAQDTATSLGLSVSPYMQGNDMPVIESMIDAIFDRGDYRRIALLTVDGDTLIEKYATGDTPDVPAWFANSIQLQAPVAEALVMSGWRQAGSIHVTSNPDNAQRELWRNAVDTFWLYLTCAAVFMLLLLLALRVLLRPLHTVEQQANEICNNRYTVQTNLPKTRELRRVVVAMNHLAEKVGRYFREQSTLTEKIRAQSYRDTLTGLGNRRYFNRRLGSLLQTGDGPTQGALLMLELRDFSRLNETAGFVTGDRVIARVAEIITELTKPYEHCFAARISGAGFAVVATGLSSESADELAAMLCHGLLQLRADGLVESHDIGHVGVAMWQQQNTLPDVLSEADVALRSAQACGQNTWQRFAPAAANQSSIFSAAHWRVMLQDTITSRSLILESQPVYGTHNHARSIIHHEVLARLPDSKGNGIAASVFMPMAERLNLASQLDKLAASLLIEQLAATESLGLHALNLSASALKDAVFLQWLCSLLEKERHICRRLQIEFPEYAVLASLQNTRNLIERLGDIGCLCGIDHFGHGFNSIAYLRSLGITYLKLDSSYTRNIDSDEDNQFFVKALIDTVHSIDIDVIAQGVETPAERTLLESLSIDGIQGFLAGKPGPLALAARVV